jgi:hypothetical protein
MVTLLTWECGLNLYEPQKFEVHLHSIGLEHETMKMAQVNQGLRVGSALSSGYALSRKAHCNYLLAVPLTGEESSIRVLPDLSLYNITLTPILRDEIMVAQKIDEGMAHIRRRMQEGDPRVNCFHEDAEETLWFKDRLVMPKKEALKKKILNETHMSRYSIQPSSTKMYHDLRQQFWWTWMKRETARYVSECDTCQKVKADYMKLRGLLQPLSILDWKWDDISMNFIMGLPLTARKFDSIWVLVDRLTKSAHFIPIHTKYRVEKYVKIYIARVLCLHGVPKMIISNWGSQFVARFWEQLHPSLGPHLIHSLAYHPQTDGQTESKSNSGRYAKGLCDRTSW